MVTRSVDDPKPADEVECVAVRVLNGRKPHALGGVLDLARSEPTLSKPIDALVRQVLGQIVFRVVRRLYRRGVVVEARLVLIRFAANEAIEMLKAVGGRPVVERALEEWGATIADFTGESWT